MHTICAEVATMETSAIHPESSNRPNAADAKAVTLRIRPEARSISNSQLTHSAPLPFAKPQCQVQLFAQSAASGATSCMPAGSITRNKDGGEIKTVVHSVARRNGVNDGQFVQRSGKRWFVNACRDVEVNGWKRTQVQKSEVHQ